MVVIGYKLGYGQTIVVMVPSDQVQEDQILGDVRAWCPTCHVEHPVTQVRLKVR